MTDQAIANRKWLKTTHNIYVFMVEGKPFGIDIDWIKEIKEINSTRSVTPVPHTARSVMGYINVRGEINQVVSLSQILMDRDSAMSNSGLIIYFKDKAGINTGAYAQSIREIISVEDSLIDRWDNDRPEKGKSPAEYVTCGVCRNGNEIIHLLSAERLCEAASFNW